VCAFAKHKERVAKFLLLFYNVLKIPMGRATNRRAFFN